MNVHIKTIMVIAVILLTAIAIAEQDDSIFPNAEQLGMSVSEIKAGINEDFIECEVGKKEGLMIKNVIVGAYLMDAYYVFGKKMQTSLGESYYGLSKVTYIFNGAELLSTDDFNRCYEATKELLVDTFGDPDSAGKSVNIWKTKDFKIQIGKGRFENYTGSKEVTIGIVFSGLEIPKVRELGNSVFATENNHSENSSDESTAIRINTGQFASIITNGVDYEIDEWYRNADTRALLTVCLMADACISGFFDTEDTRKILFATTYVARSGDEYLLIMGFNNKTQFDIMYYPTTKQAFYHDRFIETVTDEEDAKNYLASIMVSYEMVGFISGYYQNYQDSITNEITWISESIR